MHDGKKTICKVCLLAAAARKQEASVGFSEKISSADLASSLTACDSPLEYSEPTCVVFFF